MAGDDAVMARNAAVSGSEDEGSGDEGKGAGKGYPTKKEKEPVAAEVVEGAEKPKPVKKVAADTGNLNAQKRNEEVEGVELSRKQREEIEKEQRRRAYEALHKAGKTDEAKADLGRLEEVKKRRAEAELKRAEDKAKAEAAEADKMIAKGGMSKEVKEALGGDAARTGSRTQNVKKSAPRVQNDVNLYSYAEGADIKKVEKTKTDKVAEKPNEGTMAACREAEDDFM